MAVNIMPGKDGTNRPTATHEAASEAMENLTDRYSQCLLIPFIVFSCRVYTRLIVATIPTRAAIV